MQRGCLCAHVCSSRSHHSPGCTAKDLIFLSLLSVPASCQSPASHFTPPCTCPALPTSPAPAKATLQPTPHYRSHSCNYVQAFTPAVVSLGLADSRAMVLPGCRLLLTLLLSQPQPLLPPCGPLLAACSPCVCRSAGAHTAHSHWLLNSRPGLSPSWSSPQSCPL